MTTFLKTLFLVNALLAATFALFIELCKWCALYHVTAWLAFPGTLAICAVVYWKTVGLIARRFG